MEKLKENDHLRTRNKILLELNDSGYYVTKPFVKDCEFDYLVYTRSEGQYIKYLCGVNTKPSRKESVLFNGKAYRSISDLLSAVDLFNQHRMFPPEYYDPGYTKEYITEGKVSWYLTDKLGFKPSRDMNGHMRTYVKKDLYGQLISSIGLDVDKDGSGRIVRMTTANSWMSNDFTDALDAVAKINGILILELASNVSKSLDALTQINAASIKVTGVTKTVVDGSLNVFKEDYQDKIVRELETILDKLKNDTTESAGSSEKLQ